MAKPLLTDELWERIQPLLPLEAPKPKGGRPRVPNRAALTGIYLCCGPVANGNICRRKWAADAA